MLTKLLASEIEEYARSFNLHVSSFEAHEFKLLADMLFDAVDHADGLVDPPSSVYLDRRVRTVTPSEDPYNAIVRRCDIREKETGLLAGKRIGLKDNISVAGVPMTCGSRLLSDYESRQDAVVVERLLSHGAAITAILNMDSLAVSAYGDSSDHGPVLNPFDSTRLAGGSSSGSAAALHYPDFDITFGTDQGGSIRLPAAWCGVIGLKPSFGLVPFTGIVSHDRSFDHVGPLARTVADLALGLQAVAGQDDRDPFTCRTLGPHTFVKRVAESPTDLRGVKVGYFGDESERLNNADAGVRHQTTLFIDRLANLGAEVREVTLSPEMSRGQGLVFALYLQAHLASSLGFREVNVGGRYSPEFSLAIGGRAHEDAGSLPVGLKFQLILGLCFQQRYHGAMYGAAQNYRAELRRDYDRILKEVDIIVMPTANQNPPRLGEDETISGRIQAEWSIVSNAAHFSLTGHPSISVPGGFSDGVPVGIMMTTNAGRDADLLSWARIYEGTHGPFFSPATK